MNPKSILIFIFAAAMLAGVSSCSDDDSADSIDVTGEFDPLFARELQHRGYIADASRITPKDVKNIREVNVFGTFEEHGPLTSLAGIEYFESLEKLNCSYNHITELDVTKNRKLAALWCHYNQLTELDISKNRELTQLYCDHNPGDGTVFPVIAWFGNDNIPYYFGPRASWEDNGKTITVDYRKAE